MGPIRERYVSQIQLVSRRLVADIGLQTNAKYGYFLDQDIRDFDAGFFNISGNEAEAMDPQQRLLLEVVYEALENGMRTILTPKHVISFPRLLANSALQPE